MSNADIIGKTSNFIEIKKKKLQKIMEDEEQEEIDSAVITEALPLPSPTDDNQLQAEENKKKRRLAHNIKRFTPSYGTRRKAGI